MTSPKKKAASEVRKRAKPGAASTQDLYTGMSGQLVAMSELLWRGYNVAIPVVDVGEDIFVVEAENGVLRRVQVKTAGTGTRKAGAKTVQFTLSRSQLDLSLGGSELFFMLLARWDDMDPRKLWRFILIRRDELNALRLAPARGRRRPAADAGLGDALKMNVTFSGDDAVAWGRSLKDWLDGWSKDWPIAGPMKVRAPSGTLTPIVPLVLASAPPRASTAGPGTTQPETAPPASPPRRP